MSKLNKNRVWCFFMAIVFATAMFTLAYYEHEGLCDCGNFIDGCEMNYNYTH
mgnify:CR=1 FL=1